MMRWQSKPLRELAIDLQPGFACKPSQAQSGIPQIRPLNLQSDGRVTLEGTKAVECSPKQQQRYALSPGDIIFNNTNSPELVGKSGIFREHAAYVFSNHITRIRLQEDKIIPEFLFRFFLKRWRDGYFQHHCTQWVNQAAINVDALSAIEVPLPSLAEQKRIVKLLDEADELRKLRAQADRRMTDLIPALFNEMFGNAMPANTSWPSKALGMVGKVVTGNTPSRKVADYYGTFLEWVKTDNINALAALIHRGL